MFAALVGLEAGIANARAQFGDGPYLLLEQARSLDIDGFGDTLSLLSAHADLDDARTALDRAFARACETLPDGAIWHDEQSSAVVELAPEHGVTLVEQRAIKRKDATGFNAETRVVQLLAVAQPPVIGEPLFRALRYADELALCLARYR